MTSYVDNVLALTSYYIIYYQTMPINTEAYTGSYLCICLNKLVPSTEILNLYRVIRKSLRDFRTQLRSNQDRHGRKEHINWQRISPSFFCTRGLGVLPGSTATG